MLNLKCKKSISTFTPLQTNVESNVTSRCLKSSSEFVFMSDCLFVCLSNITFRIFESSFLFSVCVCLSVRLSDTWFYCFCWPVSNHVTEREKFDWTSLASHISEGNRLRDRQTVCPVSDLHKRVRQKFRWSET